MTVRALVKTRQNAASVAALLLTSELMIVDKPEKEKPTVPAGLGMC